MSQIGDLRAALKDNLKTIPGIQVSKYRLVNPTPPGVHLWASRVVYRKAFGVPPGLSEVQFTVEAFVAFAENIGVQEYMDDFLSLEGPRSVPAAIATDRLLGGNAQDIFIETTDDVNTPLVTVDNRPLLTSAWVVTVQV